MNPEPESPPAAPDTQPRTDAHGELCHRLGLLERTCREARESLCLQTHLSRKIAGSNRAGLVLPTGQAADNVQELRETSAQMLIGGAVNLNDTIVFAQQAVELAAPVLEQIKKRLIAMGVKIQ